MVKIHAPDLESHGLSPTSVRAFFSFPLSMPWNSLSSTPSNEEVFHHILQRGRTAISPGSISFRLFQALVSHYYSGKTKQKKSSYSNPAQRLMPLGINVITTREWS